MGAVRKQPNGTSLDGVSGRRKTGLPTSEKRRNDTQTIEWRLKTKIIRVRVFGIEYHRSLVYYTWYPAYRQPHGQIGHKKREIGEWNHSHDYPSLYGRILEGIPKLLGLLFRCPAA